MTDGAADDTRSLTEDFVREAWRRRHELTVPDLRPDEAFREGLLVPGGPAVLAEVSDAVGGGASGDSAILLEAYLAADLSDSLAIHIVDPETVAAAKRAGVGSRFDARIGTSSIRGTARPCAQATVISLFEGRFTYGGGLTAGVEDDMGACAVLSVGGATVLVSTHSAYRRCSTDYIDAEEGAKSSKRGL